MADKRISIVFDASMEVGQIKNAVSRIQKEMEGIALPKGLSTDFTKILNNLNKEITKFEQEASKGATGQLNFDTLTKSGNKVLNLYQDLQVAAKQLGNLSEKDLQKLFPKEIADNIQKAKSALEDYSAAIKKNEADEKSKNAELEKTSKLIEKTKDRIKELENTKGLTKDEFKKLGKNAEEASDKVKELQNKLQPLYDKKNQLENTLAQPQKSSSYRNLITDINEYEKALKQAQEAERQAQLAKDTAVTQVKINSELTRQNKTLEEQTQKFQELKKAISDLTSAKDTNLNALFTVLKQIPGIDLSKFSTDANGAAQAIAELQQKGLINVSNSFNGFRTAVDEGASSVEKFKTKTEEASNAQRQLDDRMRDVSALKSRIQYFFGINNAINLVRRALTSTFQTIKELDAAMTQTAVVTDFTIADMWKTLPEYTDRANQLGTTIKGVYEASTLYYQQGLDTNEVVGVSTETLKMAKIAGLDYAQATDYMTAALRGFNMEVNELNATKVNDIYSKLAAITAADTEEIATAMTKTASIASNANMEIETTAAFLSQIIETTRESAETAGTAMKTVIARFQELKKDPSEIGEVEGEIVDANQIEGALRTVGVALRDVNGQFRDLDDVFLELAKKWKTLDTNTQRYIATIAAGSRQQSRFIAMMSDYERTMELVSAANNSAGASQEQFEKTLDSLESKLSQLKNSWNEFLLGITNSEVIKVAVDLLTKLIDTLNKLTDLFGETGGAFAKFLTAFSAFKVGKYMLGAQGILTLFGGKSGAEYQAAGQAAAGKFYAGLQSGFKGLEGKLKGQLPTVTPVHLEKLGINQKVLQNYGDAAIGKYAETGMPKDVQADYDKVNNFLGKYNSNDIKGTEKALAELGASAEAGKEVMGNLSKQVEIARSNLNTLASTAQATGMALFFLSSLIPDDKRFAPFKKGITTVATALMGLSMIMKVVIPLAGEEMALKLNAALVKSPWLIGIGIAIGLFVGLAEAIETTTEKQERLKKQTEEAARKTAELTDEYNKLIDTIEGLEEAEKTLDTLIEGSDAWKDKVEEINQEMLELVKLYPQLKKYLSLGTDGVYTWTDDGAALEELAQLRLEARNDALATEAGLAQESLNITLKTNNTVSATINPSNPFQYTDDFGNIQYTENPITGKINSTQAFSSNQLLKMAEAYASDKSIFGSRENFVEKLGTTGYSEDFLNNLTEFEGQLIPILEQILDAQQLAEQTQQNYLTELLSSNSDQFTKSENKDYVRDRIQNSEKWTKYSENYDTNEKIEARVKAELEAQGYEDVKVKVGANGEVTYSYKNGEENVSGSMGAKETVATNYAMEDYSKSGDLETDVQKYEEQRQREIERLTKQYIAAGVDETLARTTAAEMVDEAAKNDGIYEKTGILKTIPEEYGQLLEHLDISKLNALNEQLKGTGSLGKAVVEALEAIQQGIRETNEKSTEFDRKQGLNAKLLESYKLFDLNTEAAETFKKQVAEITGLEGDALDAAVIAKLEFEWADDQIDEVYDEVMAAFKMNADDPRKIQAFKNLLPTFKKLLKNENLTLDFIIENEEEVKNFLNGTEDSLKKLKEESTIDLLVKTGMAEQQVRDLMKEFEGLEIEVGMKIKANKSEFVKGLNELLKAGKITEPDASNALINLGFLPNWTTRTLTEIKQYGNNGPRYTSVVGEYEAISSITSVFDTDSTPYTPPEDKDKGKEDSWENPYDKQYNTLEKIDELLRQRELLEKQYQKLQTKGEANYENTKKYYDDLFASLTEEAKLQKQLHDDIVKDELNPFLANNKNLAQYATYSEETGLLQIEWDKIEALETAAKEQGETLEKEIAELKRLSKAIEQSADQQAEIEVNRANAEKELQDAYLAFEERLAAALENIEREALEEQQKLFDALTSAEEQLVDALNRNVDEMRQARENEQRQQEISDKERRLAYLRQDTTGANQLEIRQLEKEIGEEKENYRDELIDQSLEKLQKQNEAAAEQREKQISLMESQIEYAVENGLYNKEAAQMLKNASKNGFAYDPKIWNTLRNGENWDAKTETAVKAVKDAVKQDLATAIVALANSLGTETSLSNSNNNSSGGGGSSGRTFSAHGSTGTYTIGSEKGITFLVGAQPGDTLTSSDTGDKSTWTMGSDGTATITTQNGDSFTINRADLGLKPFATGGLADFTGPAWLDGTRSKPELVLNAQDTENFIILKDVLSGVLANAPGAKSSGGDNYFDIDVNVEEIGSDYDVDQMAERIKQNIYQDGMYRNVNTINLLR